MSHPAWGLIKLMTLRSRVPCSTDCASQVPCSFHILKSKRRGSLPPQSAPLSPRWPLEGPGRTRTELVLQRPGSLCPCPHLGLHQPYRHPYPEGLMNSSTEHSRGRAQLLGLPGSHVQGIPGTGDHPQGHKQGIRSAAE